MRIYFFKMKKMTYQKEISWIAFFYCVFIVLILKLELQCSTQVTALLHSWAKKKKNSGSSGYEIAEYNVWNKVYSISFRDSQG